MVDRMSTIISVQGLNLWYSANQALYDVSMELPEHEITAFIKSFHLEQFQATYQFSS